jgi:biopolymer transport protein ExbB/TolQ
MTDKSDFDIQTASDDDSNRLVRVLNWTRDDIEQRIGFKGGKYTDTNNRLSLMMAIVLTCIAYMSFYAINLYGVGQNTMARFIDRGITPYFIVFFSAWALSILAIKNSKLAFQRKALALRVVPESREFSLAPGSAIDVLDRMRGLVDDPKHFVLLNRIERALSNLNNMGMVADVSEVLRSQAENDEDHMDSSYSLLRGFIWGIPILGFIGTVLGLSTAIGRFGQVVGAGDAIETLQSSLQEVTGGLAIAFDTTLIALVAALIIQLILTAVRKREESFLDACRDYCHSHIISRLRLQHLTSSEDE